MKKQHVNDQFTLKIFRNMKDSDEEKTALYYPLKAFSQYHFINRKITL